MAEAGTFKLALSELKCRNPIFSLRIPFYTKWRFQKCKNPVGRIDIFKTSAVINKNFKLLKCVRMTDGFVCFSLSKKRRTTNKLLAAEIMRNSRDHVSCAQHLMVTYAFKRLKNSHFENLNDAGIISIPMFEAC